MCFFFFFFLFCCFFFFKQKTAYEMCGRDWSSDVCSSDLITSKDSYLEDEILFGIHPIHSALARGRRLFKNIFIRTTLHRQLAYPESNLDTPDGQGLSDIWKCTTGLGLPVSPVNNSKLDKLAKYGIHQGICAMVSPYQSQCIDNSDVGVTTRPVLWLLIDNVKDPMNMGALVRSAVYFGVGKLIVSPSCSRLSPVVSKASAGAMEYGDIYQVRNSAQLLEELKASGWDILGAVCSSDNSTHLSEIRSVNRNTLLIIGSESRGVDNSLLDYCNRLVNISAAPGAPPYLDSLNVGVATGVMLNHFTQLLR